MRNRFAKTLQIEYEVNIMFGDVMARFIPSISRRMTLWLAAGAGWF
jgi:hypothetical protein